jgi:drug/metabolite transporter (DMT)-like permease
MLCGAVPIFSAPVQAVMMRKLPRAVMVAGLVVGFSGVVLVSLPSLDSDDAAQATGVVLVLLATVCYGISVNIAIPIQQKYGSLPLMMRMLALASIWTAPWAIAGLAGSKFQWKPFAAVMVAGTLGTGIAYVLMGELVGRAGSTRASFITYIIPVVALVLGTLFKDDTVENVALIGVGLIIVGAFLASRKEEGH